jgi:hypothetical protein
MLYFRVKVDLRENIKHHSNFIQTHRTIITKLFQSINATHSTCVTKRNISNKVRYKLPYLIRIFTSTLNYKIPAKNFCPKVICFGHEKIYQIVDIFVIEPSSKS